MEIEWIDVKRERERRVLVVHCGFKWHIDDINHIHIIWYQYPFYTQTCYELVNGYDSESCNECVTKICLLCQVWFLIQIDCGRELGAYVIYKVRLEERGF